MNSFSEITNVIYHLEKNSDLLGVMKRKYSSAYLAISELNTEVKISIKGEPGEEIFYSVHKDLVEDVVIAASKHLLENNSLILFENEADWLTHIQYLKKKEVSFEGY